MSEFFQWLSKNPIATNIVIATFGVVVVAVVSMYVIAFIQGRSVSFWPLKIGESTDSETKSLEKQVKPKANDVPRICILGSVTSETEIPSKKLESLKYFYKCFVRQMYRMPYGFNACGAEPWREIFYLTYCERLKTSSKSQMRQIDDKVCWYWFPGDDRGFNYEPAFYKSVETRNVQERLITEVTNSAVILALAGRTGTKTQVELLLSYHRQKKYGVDFGVKPFVLLAWFGGSIKDFILENQKELAPYMAKYPELMPDKELEGWENNRELLENQARKLTETLVRLVLEKSGKDH